MKRTTWALIACLLVAACGFVLASERFIERQAENKEKEARLVRAFSFRSNEMNVKIVLWIARLLRVPVDVNGSYWIKSLVGSVPKA